LVRIAKRVQDEVWQAFVDWCLSRGLKAVPAHHWTLAAYALALAGHEKPDDIRKILNTVAKAHLEKSRSRPDRHPLVERTLKAIALRKETEKQRSKLFDADLTVTEKTKKRRASKKNPKEVGPANRQHTRTMSVTPKLVRRRRLAK